MPTIDRQSVALRVRALLAGQGSFDLGAAAARLAVKEGSLRMSLDDIAPYPTVEVLTAVIREFGVDPSWLLWGTYDASTHRSATESEDLGASVREMMGIRHMRNADETTETRHATSQN